MKNVILSLLFMGLSITNNAQVFVENPQYFEWDTSLSWQGVITSGFDFARILATEEGVCVSSKKYHDPLMRQMTKELHFFDASLNYLQTVNRGITGDESVFGRSEDFFLYNGKFCVLDLQAINLGEDSLDIFHCFSIYNASGSLQSTDTLWGLEYYPFYDGNNIGLETPTGNKHISGNYVYYLRYSNTVFDTSSRIIRCDLSTAQFEVFDMNPQTFSGILSFLDADSSTFLIEKLAVVNGYNRHYFNLIDYTGSVLTSQEIGDLTMPNLTRAIEYINEEISTPTIYRWNSETDRGAIEFLNADFSLNSSIDIHGDDYSKGQIIHKPGSNTMYLVLSPRTLAAYNYRCVEIDISARAIVQDTTFEIPLIFRPLGIRQFIIDPEEGNFIQYGIIFRGNKDLPFFHRINVFERKAYIDSIIMPYNDSFQNTDFLNIYFANGQYYFVALDELSAIDGELNNYCVGTLSIPTSIKPSPTSEFSFTIAPNPASHQISLLNLPAEPLGVHVIDLQGRTLYSGYSNRQSSIDLSVEQLSAGIYFVSVQGANGGSTQKFIIH